MKCFIVIAAYHEESAIGDVIKSLKKEGYKHIVVVDDGSKDNTGEAAKKAGAVVLTHIINRGQGAALRTGFQYALSKDADVVVTFDADGQHEAKEIKHLLKPIRENKAEAVLGSRFLRQESIRLVPGFKRFLLKGGIIFTWVMSGIKLTDAHNGFRAISSSALRKMDLHQDKMEHASEIVEEIHKKKIPYLEVPVTIRYTEYSKQHGQSHLNSLKIAFNLIMRKFLK